jgi:hypothetical protein
MGLREQAKADIAAITSNLDEWGCLLKFDDTKGNLATIGGLHTKHHLGVDSDGNRTNSKNSHCSFSEQFMIPLGYPVRNEKKEVAMIGHLVTVADSSGTEWTYVITESYPDETIGLIVCILGDYNPTDTWVQ